MNHTPIDRRAVLAAQDYLGNLLNCEVFATGSTLMYGTGNDLDVVVYDTARTVHTKLVQDGYTECGDPTYALEFGDDSEFRAYRKGDINAIVVYTEQAWRDWCVATLVVLKLGDWGVTLDKEQRASLFSSIRSEDPLGELDDRAEYNRG